MNAVIIEPVSKDSQVEEILQLQQSNLAQFLNEKEISEQGFVTVQHEPDVLKTMNHQSPSIIATFNQKVVGYALVMPKNFRNSVPVLEPMFRIIDSLSYKSLPLSSYNYFIMGQVCIQKNFRGQGVFDQLYAKLRDSLSNRYQLLITEVANRNQRSINAHLRVGLKTIHRYTDSDGENWELMVWDWRSTLYI
ncbi:MAG: GNAT family N-acetyltransferase [Chitinophagaceae bacterium]|nr:GNAT family N-acetyltransferase [Chitinophagaceae bacterium]